MQHILNHADISGVFSDNFILNTTTNNYVEIRSIRTMLEVSNCFRQSTIVRDILHRLREQSHNEKHSYTTASVSRFYLELSTSITQYNTYYIFSMYSFFDMFPIRSFGGVGINNDKNLSLKYLDDVVIQSGIFDIICRQFHIQQSKILKHSQNSNNDSIAMFSCAILCLYRSMYVVNNVLTFPQQNHDFQNKIVDGIIHGLDFFVINQQQLRIYCIGLLDVLTNHSNIDAVLTHLLDSFFDSIDNEHVTANVTDHMRTYYQKSIISIMSKDKLQTKVHDYITSNNILNKILDRCILCINVNYNTHHNISSIICEVMNTDKNRNNNQLLYLFKYVSIIFNVQGTFLYYDIANFIYLILHTFTGKLPTQILFEIVSILKQILHQSRSMLLLQKIDSCIHQILTTSKTSMDTKTWDVLCEMCVQNLSKTSTQIIHNHKNLLTSCLAFCIRKISNTRFKLMMSDMKHEYQNLSINHENIKHVKNVMSILKFSLRRLTLVDDIHKYVKECQILEKLLSLSDNLLVDKKKSAISLHIVQSIFFFAMHGIFTSKSIHTMFENFIVLIQDEQNHVNRTFASHAYMMLLKLFQSLPCKNELHTIPKDRIVEFTQIMTRYTSGTFHYNIELVVKLSILLQITQIPEISETITGNSCTCNMHHHSFCTKIIHFCLCAVRARDNPINFQTLEIHIICQNILTGIVSNKAHVQKNDQGWITTGHRNLKLHAPSIVTNMQLLFEYASDKMGHNYDLIIKQNKYLLQNIHLL